MRHLTDTAALLPFGGRFSAELVPRRAPLSHTSRVTDGVPPLKVIVAIIKGNLCHDFSSKRTEKAFNYRRRREKDSAW